MRTPSYTVIHGDALDHVRLIKEVDAIVSDPPYGVKVKTDNTRFSKGLARVPRKDHKRIIGDDRPFDPTPWIAIKSRKTVLWGANFYSDKLPLGGWLLWIKRRETALGKFMGDAECAWINTRKACYVNHHVWSGFDRESEKGTGFHHPTQKPVALMRWCFDMLNLKPGMTVLDPYMGSGSTGVAAMQAGLDFVGIERDEAYYEMAKLRIRTAMLATDPAAMLCR